MLNWRGMTESILVPAAVFALLLACAAGGAYLQTRLPEAHRSRETTDAVRAATSMIVTVAAVALGLMANSANESLNQIKGQVQSYAAALIELDQTLREYGPETAPLRQILRTYVAAATADTWKREPPPPGDYYPRPLRGPHHGQIESVQLGEMLTRIETALRRLNPPDPFHQGLAQASLITMGKVLDRRWSLIQSAQVGVSVPFLVVLLLWLAVVFVCFGLTAPRNALAHAILALGALVIASAVFLLLEMGQPFTGFVAVPSEPFRDALAHISQ